MDLAAVIRSLLRRWYVVLAGLLITGAAGYAVLTQIPPTYTASGTVLLLPPTATVEGENPLLQLGGLEQPASLVVAYLAGSSARAEFAETFPTAEYDIVVDPLSRGPLLVVTMQDVTEQGTMDALQALLDQVPATLDLLQDDVAAPAVARLGSTPLTVDVEPTVSSKDALRAVVVVGVGGIALTLLLAVGIDGVSRQRRSRRATKATGSGPAQTESTPTPPVTSSETDSAEAELLRWSTRAEERERDSRRVSRR